MIRDQLIFGLGRLAAVARQDEWSTGEREGLTPTQGEILRLLATRKDGARPKEIAQLVSVTMPTASDAISALVRKELVEKLPVANDLRAVSVVLTRTGAALVSNVESGFNLVADALGEDDQTAMLSVVSRAIQKMQRSGKIAPQRLCVTCQYFVRDAYPNAASPHHCSFVNAPLAVRELRIDCPDHQPTDVLT